MKISQTIVQAEFEPLLVSRIGSVPTKKYVLVNHDGYIMYPKIKVEARK